MQIISLSPGGFWANTYIITEDGKRAVVVDPAQPKLFTEIEKLGLTVEGVLLTHCHFDHVRYVAHLKELGAKAYCSAPEKELVGTDADLVKRFQAPCYPYTVDETFLDGEEKTLAGMSVQCIHTPGHTAGSCCYLFTAKDGKRYLFTGDTLFLGSIGRTDFPTGDISKMRASLKKLSALDGDMPVFAGHEDETTLDNERKNNPFMQNV